MNKKEKRRYTRKKKPRCSRCKHAGYYCTINPHFHKPHFVCDNCGHLWSVGMTGGEYAGHEIGMIDYEEYLNRVKN